MPLRNPVYLDLETLEAQAQYHEIDFPLPAEVVEKTTRARSAEAGAQVGPLTARGKGGKDVELQRSYTLAPKHKTVVSRAMDALIAEGHVQTDVLAGVSRDDLLQVEGRSSLMPCSTVGKLMHIALLAMQDAEVTDFNDLDMDSLEPGFLQHAKRAYVDNTLLPIPLLLRLEAPADAPSIYLDLQPGQFLDSRSIDDVEGEIRVLATVDKIIDDGDFYSAERWLLPGWERMMKRLTMASSSIEEAFVAFSELFDVDVPDEDIKPYLSGPALILSTIAIY